MIKGKFLKEIPAIRHREAMLMIPIFLSLKCTLGTKLLIETLLNLLKTLEVKYLFLNNVGLSPIRYKEEY